MNTENASEAMTKQALQDSAEGLGFNEIALILALIAFVALLAHVRQVLHKPDGAAAGRAARDERVVIVCVHRSGYANLLQIARARGGLGLFLGPAQGRYQYPHQQCNDRDNHEQLYQRESSSGPDHKQSFLMQ